MTALVAASVLLVAITAILWLIEIWHRRAAERRMRDFAERFPGKCLICSYHRWGISQGFEKPGSKPELHQCTEKEHEL